MPHNLSWKDLFTRARKPGDLVFAVLLLGGAVALAALLPWQITWSERIFDPAHPGFWPTISVLAMVVFAALHAFSSYISPRIDGRWQEVMTWLRSLEYAIWFLALVSCVPILGFLPSSVIFAAFLTARTGYKARTILAASLLALVVVLIFKAGLAVRIPGGALYDRLPEVWQPFFAMYL